MLLFSWEKVRKAGNNKVSTCYDILKMLSIKEMPANYYDPIYKLYQKDYRGSAFVLNPKPLFTQGSRFTEKEIVVYFVLASFRNLGDYTILNKTSLDIDIIPVSANHYHSNRLLYTRNNELFFLYEEVYKEN